jgi:hypothetical protein
LSFKFKYNNIFYYSNYFSYFISNNFCF